MGSGGRRAAALWTGAFTVLSASFVFLYPDSCQQDGGYHFLFARWAWVHPEFLVGVWNRPAFTVLYSLPAQLGYPAAKLLTVLLCTACAWQTWRLAVDLRLARPALAVPLVFLQPLFLLLSSETMTEPFFALLLVIAIRLRVLDRPAQAMLVTSTLVLARPEGFVVVAFWVAWELFDPRGPRQLARRASSLACLGAGAAAWWLAALVISGDPLYIPRNWPEGWANLNSPYGSGAIWEYSTQLPQVTGPLFVFFFALGLVVSFTGGRPRAPALIALSVLLFHSVLWSIGGFGTAGYPRYMVTVSPVIALVSLVGWNAVADRVAWGRPWLRTTVASAVFAVSGVISIFYVDGWPASRDSWAVRDTHAAFSSDPKPVRRLVWSHAYMAIRFDADPNSAPSWGDRKKNLKIIADLPSGTLVFWDALIGPGSFHLSDADFVRAGFERLHFKTYDLPRRLGRAGWFGIDGPRRQEMHLLYRP